jgi:hypothetical protein
MCEDLLEPLRYMFTSYGLGNFVFVLGTGSTRHDFLGLGRFWFGFSSRKTPIIVAAHSNIGNVGSNLTRGMDVCVGLFCLCCPVYR